MADPPLADPKPGPSPWTSQDVLDLMTMMGHAQQCRDFANGKGWTPEQVELFVANMGNTGYFIPVGLGTIPPEPQA